MSPLAKDILRTLAVCAVLFGGLMAAIVGIFKVSHEASCNQQGEQYGLPADYRWMSATCYLTLKDGRKIAADKYRFNEGAER